VFATMELGGSIGTSLLALLAPPLTILAIGVVLFVIGRGLLRLRASKTTAEMRKAT